MFRAMLCGTGDLSLISEESKKLVTTLGCDPWHYQSRTISYLNHPRADFRRNSARAVAEADVLVLVLLERFGEVSWKIELRETIGGEGESHPVHADHLPGRAAAPTLAAVPAEPVDIRGTPPPLPQPHPTTSAPIAPHHSWVGASSARCGSHPACRNRKGARRGIGFRFPHHRCPLEPGTGRRTAHPEAAKTVLLRVRLVRPPDGEQLFPETFYAMEKGTVVGELLSAHASLKTFTQKQLADQFTEREVDPQPLNPYVERIIDAVWDKHRNTHFMDLVDQTHGESVWITACEGRRPGSKRENLPAEDLVVHFLLKERPPQEQLDLPLSLVSHICEETLAEVDAPIESATPFVETIRRLQPVS